MNFKIIITVLFFLLWSCSTEKEILRSTNRPFDDTLALETLKQKPMNYEMPEQYLDSANFFGGALQAGSLTFIYDDSTKLFKDSTLSTFYDFDLSKKDSIYICYYMNKKLIVGNQAHDIYYAKVHKRGMVYQGYIPEHKLSFIWKPITPKTMLYVTVRDFNADKSPIAKARIYKDGSFVNEISFAPAYQTESGSDTLDYYYCLSVSTVDSTKLTQVQKIIKIDSNYPACGYSSGESILLYGGSAIYFGLSTSNYFDAGIVANYSQLETPNDSNLSKNHIFVTNNTIIYEEDSDQIATHDSVVLNYEWTINNKLVFEDTIAKIKIK